MENDNINQAQERDYSHMFPESSGHDHTTDGLQYESLYKRFSPESQAVIDAMTSCAYSEIAMAARYSEIVDERDGDGKGEVQTFPVGVRSGAKGRNLAPLLSLTFGDGGKLVHYSTGCNVTPTCTNTWWVGPKDLRIRLVSGELANWVEIKTTESGDPELQEVYKLGRSMGIIQNYHLKLRENGLSPMFILDKIRLNDALPMPAGDIPKLYPNGSFARTLGSVAEYAINLYSQNNCYFPPYFSPEFARVDMHSIGSCDIPDEDDLRTRVDWDAFPSVNEEGIIPSEKPHSWLVLAKFYQDTEFSPEGTASRALEVSLNGIQSAPTGEIFSFVNIDGKQLFVKLNLAGKADHLETLIINAALVQLEASGEAYVGTPLEIMN